MVLSLFSVEGKNCLIVVCVYLGWGLMTLLETLGVELAVLFVDAVCVRKEESLLNTIFVL